MPKTITFSDEIEFFDEEKNEFVHIKPQTIQIEHSLVSISKWESKWHKPFLSTLDKHKKSPEEMLDYIRCMTITQNVNPVLYFFINEKQMKEIQSYIDDPMTATWFNNENKQSSSEIPTSELIYYWMISLNIPVEFQKWHLNRLLTLIKVCNVKNAPPKKMSQSELISRQRAINKARRNAKR